ncbi:hypothetical protein D6D27_05006 [Aureobasidium pullulans]|nr:hypothetical protein D6D27_05006 [Aureobasidium pullulans]
MTKHQPAESEIWDDSALVQSWNEALEEYKKYHSMSARGERVEDVLDAVEKEEEAQSATNLENELIDETTGLPRWESVEEHKMPVQESTADSAPLHIEAQAESPASVTQQPPPPQVLLDSVQDEGLKALMTSWYFAGYYTGLYEGKQQAQAQAAQSHSAP